MTGVSKVECGSTIDTSVSVVIPTFNRAKETIEAITSVLNQTHRVDEIIVVDDGSDENQFLKLKNSIRDDRISLVRIPHSGLPGVARQEGVSRSTGPWIAFLDSDDTWDPNKLLEQLKVADSHDASAICTNAFVLEKETKKLKFNFSGSYWISKRRLLSTNQIVNSSVLIKKSLLDEIGGVVKSPRVRGCEDYATWLRISNITSWFYLDRPLVVYREDSPSSIRLVDQSDNSLSHIYAILDFCAYEERTTAKQHYLLKRLLNKLWIFVLLR